MSNEAQTPNSRFIGEAKSEAASIEAVLHDLHGLHAETTPGEWSKGITTHETVSRRDGQAPYHIAEFRHANAAAFVDACHAHMPRLIAEIESLRAQVEELREDGERLECLLIGGGSNRRPVLDMYLRAVDGDEPTLDEWRSAIDAAREKAK